MRRPVRLGLRLAACVAAVVLVTVIAFFVLHVNATTVAFAYLLLVLAAASAWGFVESSVTSLAATFALNFYFFEPIGTLTINDPKNWVALFSFLTTSLVASRLSDQAKKRTQDALERQRDIERLYSFSRAILLSGHDDPPARQLVRKLADTFALSGAVLFDRRSGDFHRAGPSDFEGLDDQLKEAALCGTTFSSADRTITAVRLGAEPIASLAVQGAKIPDSVLQGVANLVAIGLERDRAQHMANEMEAAQRNEQLRTTLIDAMAHEFMTPLTLIKGATSAVLAGPNHLPASAREQISIADEEAEHLRKLMDDTVEIARLDAAQIQIHPELADPAVLLREVADSMHGEMADRQVSLEVEGAIVRVVLDRRLIKLALKQLLDNALKYSPPDSPLTLRVVASDGGAAIEVTDRGEGIAGEDQARIFDRFYRGRAIRGRIPGSGLGLNIAYRIAQAHGGDLTVASRPGETTFRLLLPLNPAEPAKK